VRYVEITFLTSAARPDQFLPADVPEVAFAGRSNVGKSSLLNSLVNRKNLARTGARPGFTTLVNFFLVEDRFRLVDLPGYGYARRSKSEIAAWQGLVESYLHRRRNLALLVWLLDCRRDPGPEELAFSAWLAERGVPVRLVLTKVDKLSRNELSKALVTRFAGWPAPLPCSVKTRQGIEELWSTIETAVAEPAGFLPEGS